MRCVRLVYRLLKKQHSLVNVPAQEILSSGVPIEAHDPASTAGQIGHLLAILDIVKCNDFGIACGG